MRAVLAGVALAAGICVSGAAGADLSYLFTASDPLTLTINLGTSSGGRLDIFEQEVAGDFAPIPFDALITFSAYPGTCFSNCSIASKDVQLSADDDTSTIGFNAGDTAFDKYAEITFRTAEPSAVIRLTGFTYTPFESSAPPPNLTFSSALPDAATWVTIVVGFACVGASARLQRTPRGMSLAQA